MAITNSFIDATLTTVYTSTGENAITSMIFCNYADADNIPGDNILTDADTYLDVHVVQSGQSATDVNKILHQLKVPAGETFIMDTEKFVMESGDKIICQTTSPATISVTISTIAV
jgi:hypothetical protein